MKIILRNTTLSTISVQDLGLKIDTAQQAEINYSEIIAVSESTILRPLLQNGSLILNNGTIDLSYAEAIDYLTIEPDLSGYSLIGHGHVKANISDFAHTHDERYYSEEEVDSKVAAISVSGIKGAVDYFVDLPTTGNTVGDIYIVRYTSGVGPGSATGYTSNTNTMLHLKLEHNITDEKGHVGTLTGSIAYDEVAINQGAIFNGTQKISFSDSTDFTVSTQLSGGCWAYFNTSDRIEGIFGQANIDNSRGWGIINYNGLIKFWGMSTVGSDLHLTSPARIGELAHYGFSYDGTTVRLYVNGVLTASGALSPSILDSNNILEVGGLIGLNKFRGQLDDVFITKQVLNQTSFETIYNGGVFASYKEEGFYKYEDSWKWMSHNTGEMYHNSLLGLNESNFKHLSELEKTGLVSGTDTTLHTHDGRYFTETEMTTLLSGKSDTSHLHDSRYYTESEIDTKLSQITYTTVSDNDPNTNVTGTELETLTNGANADGLHTHSFMAGNTSLDGAYDIGRFINVDAGSVRLVPTGGYAPLQLVSVTSTPTQSLAAGMLCVYDNTLFLYDAVRTKWLSVDTTTFEAGKNSSGVKNTYLQTVGAVNSSSSSGLIVPWNAPIVTIACSLSAANTNILRIRANGVDIPNASIAFTSAISINNDVNADITAGEILSFYIEGSDGGCAYPVAYVIFKRRI